MTPFYQALDRLYQQGNPQAVEARILAELDRLKRMGKSWDPECAQVANELAGFYRGVSRYEESLLWFRQTLEILRQCGLEESEGYASAEMNCAGTLRLIGELPQAEQLFLAAKTRLERLGLTDGYVYNSVRNNLALVYQSQDRLEEAEQLAQQSLAWNRRQSGSEHEVATALNNLAAIYQRRGSFARARALIQEALALYDQMAEPNVHHAAALETCAMLWLKEGKWEEALACFRLAREKTEQFFGRNIEYAVASESIAVVLAKLSRWEEAVATQQEAVALKRQITGADSPAVVAAEQLLQRMQDRRDGEQNGMSGTE